MAHLRSVVGLILLSLLCSFTVPSVLNAASFVNQPIFLSKTPAVLGQKVRVFAVISNDQASSFVGQVVLTQDGQSLGTSSASIAAGAAQTVSASLTPMSSGPHAISADLYDTSGTRIQHVSQMFVVQVPEVPAATTTGSLIDFPNPSTTKYQSASQIEQTISTLSPAVATTSRSVFGAIDSLRQTISQSLDGAIQRQQTALASSSSSKSVSGTAGASTPNPQKGVTDASYSYEHPLRLIYLYVLMIVRFIVNTAIVCYLAIVIIVPYVLWKVIRLVLRRRSTDE